MKKTILILSILFLSKGAVLAQSLDSLLKSVEEKNPRLIASQKWLEAEEAQAKTGIYPDNPEIGYNYLFGSPDEIGDLQEFEIIQPFKLPGYYTSKSAIQKLEYQQKELVAIKEKKSVTHTTHLVYFNIVWLTKKEGLLRKRKEESEQLAALMQEGFSRGEISKPVYDKARIYTISVQNEWQKTKTDIQISKEQLKQLNGGDSINNLTFEYPKDWLLPSLDSIIAKLPKQNPDLQIAELGIKENETRLKHQKMSNWPSFEIGYKSETILDQKLRGFHAGITIPLWKNSRRIKTAKLQSEWSEANYKHKESEARTRLISLYNKTQGYFNNHSQISTIINEQNITESNLKLLEAGQISFPEYLIEQKLVSEAIETCLLNERDYYLNFSEIKYLLSLN